MQTVRALRDKVLKSLLFGRFEPIETALSASSFIHGLIIIGSLAVFDNSILGVNPSIEVFAGSSLVIAGVSLIRSICRDYSEVRRFSMFGQFLAWTMLTALILESPNFVPLVHLGYATLSTIAAFLYLNLSLGVKND